MPMIALESDNKVARGQSTGTFELLGCLLPWAGVFTREGSEGC